MKIRCADCGELTEDDARGRPRLRCPECAARRRREQIAEWRQRRKKTRHRVYGCRDCGHRTEMIGAALTKKRCFKVKPGSRGERCGGTVRLVQR